MEKEKEKERPLRKMAECFEEISSCLGKEGGGGEGEELLLSPFSEASSHVSILFRYLGIAFKFAERDYVSKVNGLIEASKEFNTLSSLIELDIKNNTLKNAGSHSRNLLRVKRGLDMIRMLFQHLLETNEGNSLRASASKAYEQVFSQHHSFPIRAAVGAGFYTLPTRSQLLNYLNEDEDSAREPMQKYVGAVGTVIKYVEGLYTSRELGIDW